MDLFRFLNPTAPTRLEQGEIINGLTSIMWIERYREAGEFTLTDLSIGSSQSIVIFTSGDFEK